MERSDVSDRSLINIPLFAGIAQLVERLLAKEKVAGSNPVSRSLFGYLRKPGHLAQLVERFVYIEDVGGPSPSVTTLIL